jgi:hypothetical protein
VRRGRRIVAWVVVFAACAGLGAFVASRTNPFPPGVEDPGAQHLPSPSPSVVSDARHWSGGGAAASYHLLYVGGRCTSRWRLVLRFTVDDHNRVDGTGTATLRGRLHCDFPVAQVQTRLVDLHVGGRRTGSSMRLSLSPTALTPVGSSDYGGLIRTLPAFPPLEVRARVGHVSRSVSVPDGDQGTYDATYDTTVACSDC